MSQLDHQSTTPTAPHAEQRAFPRYPVRLPAICRAPRTPDVINCEIRDFCVGGMYLVYGGDAPPDVTPRVGDTIEIGCSIPDTVGSQALRFLARVVRANGDSAGVALLDPDLPAIQALQAFATTQSRRSAVGDHARAAAGGGPHASATVDAYRRIVGNAVTPIVHAFLDSTEKRLYELAQHASDMTSQSLYLDTQAMIKRSGREIKERMVKAVAAGTIEAPGPADPAAAPSGAIGTTLTLMGHDELENWLAVSDIVNRVETEHHIVLGEIERRLAYLHHAPLDHANNPVGPAVFAQAFQAAIEPLALEHSMKLLCFNIYKSVLDLHLAEVYQKVNKLLIGEGILPNLKPTIVHQGEGSGTAASRASPAGREEDAPSGVPAAAQAAPAAPDEQGRVARITPTQAAGQGAAAGTAPAYPDLYQIVTDLRAMQQQLSRIAGNPERAHNRASTDAAAAFDTGEILAALTQLQSDPAATAAKTASSGELQASILSALSAHHGKGEKHIGAREKGIMDVAGSLFDSLLQDMMVAKSVRAWLQRLKIPMLKLAIQDDSLFLDKSHMARRVVNRISQLELYGEDEDRDQSAIQRTVDRLLDRITNEVDTDPGVFAKALKELDLLIKIQNDAYADNVRDVITRCEEEARQGEDSSTAPPPAGEGNLHDAQLREWRKRARRLRIGGWVLFTSNPAPPQRLRLAWVSKGKGRYVFVNLRGLKEASFSVDELARRLQDASAIVLDNVDEPAVDRAQYAMLQKLHHQLLHESTHDQLTGLINRREFERRLRVLLSAPEPDDCGHCLCYLDLDQFSVINSTCGYGAGDRLLIEITELARKVMGRRAVVARMGGDEFGILLANHSRQDAVGVVEEFLNAVRGYRFEWQDKRFSVSFGVGLVQSGEQGMNAAAMLQAAESSCDAAKGRGTNQIQLYRPDDTDLLKRKQIMQWVSRIDKALDEGTLTLRCQRIMALQEGGSDQAHHYEILLGVADEAGNPIAPAEFIMAAEHYHRMQAVDRWVIQSVFQWMAVHRDKLDDIGGFAINLSGRSLSDETLMDFIRTEAEKARAPMDKICFEVTETAGITNLSDATEFILEIKKTGCRFSLDDFGSGLSSYTYLKNLPVDYLKIDGAFVKDMNRNPSDFAVVKSITEIGHFMGKKIIAEYAESHDIIGRLREMGVDYAQGYTVEAPRPLDELAG